MVKFTDSFKKISVRHVQIEKANTTVIIAVSVAAALAVFSIVGSRYLISQAQYQNKVIGLLSKANDQLEENLESAQELEKSFKDFDNAPESKLGTAQKNSKIILDALPSQYDFPALATSIEGLLAGAGVTGESITGVDDEEKAEQSSTDPQPVDVPFGVSVRGTYQSAQQLVIDMERSIRPIKVLTLTLKGQKDNVTETINAVTYYQPEKKLEIKYETVPKNGSAKSKASTSKKAN